MTVTEDFLEFLTEGAVAVEVYGHKQANPRRNLALWDLGVIQAKTRSLRERYASLYNTSETDYFCDCRIDLVTVQMIVIHRVSQTRVRKLMKS